jgi:hypothetical protein
LSEPGAAELSGQLLIPEEAARRAAFDGWANEQVAERVRGQQAVRPDEDEGRACVRRAGHEKAGCRPLTKPQRPKILRCRNPPRAWRPLRLITTRAMRRADVVHHLKPACPASADPQPVEPVCIAELILSDRGPAPPVAATGAAGASSSAQTTGSAAASVLPRDHHQRHGPPS